MQDTTTNNGIIQEIEFIARRVYEQLMEDSRSSALKNDESYAEAAELQRKLALIKAKEYLTIKEAALLLSCSESHVRKLVMLGRKRKSQRPIPFVDMDGVTVFPLSELIGWARPASVLKVA